jgi:AraC-like DNA-binding protein
MTERDALADVIDVLRVRGAILAQVRASAPWGILVPQVAGASLHIITGGACWLRVGNEPARELMTGDVVLLPNGGEHIVASSARAAVQTWDRAAKSRLGSGLGTVVLGASGNTTQFICAAYDLDREVAHPFLSLLPPVVVLSERDTGGEGPLTATTRILRCELTSLREGAAAVLDRLIDILFVQVVRGWIANERARTPSWLGSLADPIVARALSHLHRTPSAAWTVDDLASRVNVSRATLARRFGQLVGESPLAYLTRWRMDLAARRLRETRDPVKVIAQDFGYTSEFAFSRAFTRNRGEAPGRYRKRFRSGRDA